MCKATACKHGCLWNQRYHEALEYYGITNTPVYYKRAIELAHELQELNLNPEQAAAVAQKCHEAYTEGLNEFY